MLLNMALSKLPSVNAGNSAQHSEMEKYPLVLEAVVLGSTLKVNH